MQTMNEEVTIDTIVDPDLLRRTLVRGSVAAGLGIVIILISAIEIPLADLAIWGIPILILGLGLIAIGLIPYKMLDRRSTNPDSLTADGEALHYSQAGKKTLTVPYSAISRIHFYERRPLYGILINLRDHPTEKVHVHTHDFDIHRMFHRTRKRFNADLFLPFFDSPRFDELRRGLALQGYVDEV